MSGNAGNGLHVTDSDARPCRANFFGTGANNTTIVGNQLDGILVDGSSSEHPGRRRDPAGQRVGGQRPNGIEVAGTVTGSSRSTHSAACWPSGAPPPTAMTAS